MCALDLDWTDVTLVDSLLSNSLSPPPKHLAARAGYLSTRLTTAVYTRVRLDCQALVSASSVLSPLPHTTLRLGEEPTPSVPKHLAARAGHRSTRLAHADRGLHTPLAHTPASREVVHVRNWEPCPLFPIISQNCVGSKTELVETPSCLVWLKNYSEAYPRLSCIIHQAHPRHVPLRATRPSMSFRKIGGANACAKPCAQSTHTRWQYVNRHYLGMSCAE